MSEHDEKIERAEAGRQEAEAERVEQEDLRQVAAERAEIERQEAELVRIEQEEQRKASEGGLEPEDEEHETGRVEAEDERVIAEEERVIAEEARVESHSSNGGAEEERVVAEKERVVAEEGRVEKRYFTARLVALVAVPVAFIMLIPTIIGLLLITRQLDENQARLRENRDTLRYVCSTTSVLDGLVAQVVVGIERNLKDGTYDRLVAAGTLPARAIVDAQEQLKEYQAAAKILADPAPCEKIDGR